MKRYLAAFLLFFIVVLGGWLRLYRLDKNPPSLSWDEAAVGYNAFTLANWGRDEWGYKFPLVFKSFEDYKHPVHIYVTAIFIKLFGLSDFIVRLPSAILGIMNIILIYLVGVTFLKKKLVGLFSAGAMALSPYAIQFSHFNHELNFAIFLFLLGIYLFFRQIDDKKKTLFFSFLALGVTLLTYHSAKVVVLPLVILLLGLFWKELLIDKKRLMVGLLPFGIVLILIVSNRQLLGLARAKQTSFSNEEVKRTVLYQKTGSLVIGRMEIVGKQYLWHFSPRYLFMSGDKNPRHSAQMVGEFYKTEIPFMLVGLILLVYQVVVRKKKNYLFLLVWILVAPLPSALVNEAPHAARAMFMLPGFLLLIGLGLEWVTEGIWKKSKVFAITILLVIAGLYFGEFYRYTKYYFVEYPDRYAIDWQYGMKGIVTASNSKDLYSVFVTDVRSQPYIFFLYNLKYPLPEFITTVEYNQTDSRSYSLVRSFGKYRFADWDPVEAIPDDTTLYAVTPSQYSGLKNKLFFDWVDVVTFPNGLDAFYLVSGKKEVELD